MPIIRQQLSMSRNMIIQVCFLLWVPLWLAIPISIYLTGDHTVKDALYGMLPGMLFSVIGWAGFKAKNAFRVEDGIVFTWFGRSIRVPFSQILKIKELPFLHHGLKKNTLVFMKVDLPEGKHRWFWYISRSRSKMTSDDDLAYVRKQLGASEEFDTYLYFKD